MRVSLSRQIVCLTLCRLLLNTGRRFIYPFAPAFGRGLDVPLAAVTSIIAVSQLTSLLGLFSGPLADRFGYRLMMRAGLFMLAVGMCICGLVPLYWPVFIGLIVASFGKTVFDPAIQAFIGHHVPFERRARVIGLVETAWAGSTLVGIPLFGLVIEYVGLRASLLLFALSASVGWFFLGYTIPVDVEDGGAAHHPSLFVVLIQLIKIRAAAGMLLFGFFISIACDCLFVVYGAWLEQDFLVGVAALGFSTAVIGGAELFGEFLTAIFADRIGLKRSMIVGQLLLIGAFLLLPFIGTTQPAAMFGIFCVFLASEFTIVTGFSLCTELIPRSRATMMAGFYATAGIGRMFGVLLGGLLWKMYGITGVCSVAAAVTCLGLTAFVWGAYDRQYFSSPTA